MRKKELELLSPAGNLEIFKGVINAGADAVYFGGELFGARAYAKNFTMDEAKEAILYAHLFGKKAYLTVNTLIKNREMEKQLYSYLKEYYEAGIDAIIVQDLGVFQFARTYFPELPIHASTQMTIANANGAKWIQNLGATRVVTSREISIPEIQGIYQNTGMEIETFVHGALCVSYSGQCLMSSMLGGRSGNRGRCAQPCRLPYDLLDAKKKQMQTRGKYLLSPKDLCGIEHIKEMADAGVYSFKIEGRMKQYAYATGVVSMYRKYMDAYLEDKDLKVTPEDKKRLLDMGNRCGFTDLYFHKQNGPEMITFDKPSHEKEDSSPQVFEKKIPLIANFTAKEREPIQLEISDRQERCSICVKGDIAEKASNRPTDETMVREKINKTGGTPFVFEEINCQMQSDLFLPIKNLTELRRQALEAYCEQVKKEHQYPKAKEYKKVEFLERTEKEKSPGKVMVSCRDLRQFQLACDWDRANEIALSFEAVINSSDEFKRVLQYGKDKEKSIYIALPIICRQNVIDLLDKNRHIFDMQQVDGVIASSLDELGYLEKINYPKERIQLDHRIYTFSNEAIWCLETAGYHRFCVPLELNRKELLHRENTSSQMLVYGRVPLMITANCQKKNALGCDRKSEVLFLQDRYKEIFPVKNVCSFCYNEIYNSKIYNVISEMSEIRKMGFFKYRLDFTLESLEEMKKIIKEFDGYTDQKGMDANDKQSIYTKGHYKRGVE